ncbi:hypothetical protein [Streptomyces lateritius]|uniref:hypothetical protein n=1 Tax=Streptomyces lateritius TaxID=67313 RepID=UPI001C8CDF58|nr:hypothetical protein [Streptomyces lateritius]MBX9427492.1 hypothetical protein [Streptomyces lateritius]
MNTKRLAATPLALGGLLQATIGTVFTVAESKDFGAPLFWGARFSVACAWFVERRSTTS